MNTEQTLLMIGFCFYLMALVISYWHPTERFYRTPLLLALFVHLGILITHSLAAQHPPFSNLYETMLLLPFLLTLRLIFGRQTLPERFHPLVLLIINILLFVAFLLPAYFKAPRPLMPALNSFWMYIHVPAYFLAYMSLLLLLIYSIGIISKSRTLFKDNINNLLNLLDNEVRIAYLFLWIGLVTGAIWAYQSWGNYWSWDPKETWALINILILTFYFHFRPKQSFRKALIVIFTIMTVIFTYWGVSFILAGLHSYI
jgi:cytochrome c-type biogenesis protein CcsB